MVFIIYLLINHKKITYTCYVYLILTSVLLQIRQSSELKRKLGITVWKEITEDVNQGLKNVKESQV